MAANRRTYKADYDQDADVLYVSVGQPRPATSDELPAGILYRRDPKSNEFLGMTVIGFLQYFVSSDEWKLIRNRFPEDLAEFIDDLRIHPNKLGNYIH